MSEYFEAYSVHRCLLNDEFKDDGDLAYVVCSNGDEEKHSRLCEMARKDYEHDHDDAEHISTKTKYCESIPGYMSVLHFAIRGTRNDEGVV